MPKTSPAEAHTEAGRQVVRSTTSFLNIVDGGEYRGMRKSPEDTKLVDAITDNYIMNRTMAPEIDPAKIGYTMAHLGATKKERAWLVCKQYPMHCVHTNAACILPVLAGCIPIAIGATQAAILVNEFPDTTAKMVTLEDLVYARSFGSMMMEVLMCANNTLSTWIMAVALLCCMFDGKIVRSCAMKTALPGAIVHASVACASVFLMWFEIDIFGLVYPVGTFAVILGMGSLSYILGKRVKDKTLWWKFFFFVVLLPVVAYLVYGLILFPNLSSMSNMQLVLLASFINPLVFEFSLICARLVTRSINEHDEACSGIPPCVAMVFKKCFGRYIIYLITDFWLALLTSIILGVWEIFAAANVAVRDRWIYKMQVACCGGGDKQNVMGDIGKVMRHPRNMMMRTRNAHNETVLELCFSMTALIFVVAYRVSLDGSAPPSMGYLFANFFQQWVTELVVDFIVIMWLTVMAKQPVIAVSHKLFKGWTLMMCIFVYWGNGYLLVNAVIDDTYARIGDNVPFSPHQGDINWFLLNDDVKAVMPNASVLCSMFPSDANIYCDLPGGEK